MIQERAPRVAILISRPLYIDYHISVSW